MSERSGFSSTQMLLAILGGAAAGATIALLVAPATGEKTRMKLSKYVDKGRDRVTDYIENGREAIGEYVEVGKDKARAIPGAVTSAGGAAGKAFSDAMRKA